jgi:hypothetical protein
MDDDDDISHLFHILYQSSVDSIPISPTYNQQFPIIISPSLIDTQQQTDEQSIVHTTQCIHSTPSRVETSPIDTIPLHGIFREIDTNIAVTAATAATAATATAATATAVAGIFLTVLFT